MSVPSSIFTAAKLAAVLGGTKRGILDRLAGVRHQTVIVAGQQAKGYALADLPSDMVAKLKELQGRYQYRSIEQLVTEGLPRTWQPIDLKLLHETEIDKASALLRAMYRVLKIGGTVANAALVDIGLADYRREFGQTITERHWRRLYDMVLTRDGGAERFDDVRLFVGEKPRLKALETAKPSDLDLQLESIQPALAAIKKTSDLSEDEVVHIWHCAFEQAETLIKQGLDRRTAKALTLDCIGNHGVALAKTDKALEKAWRRKHRVWLERGQTSHALDDRRKENKGRSPLVVMTDEEVLAVQAIVLQTDPNSSKTISVSMALRMYAQSPQCREELAQAILKGRCSKHKLTVVLKAQARVTAEMKMLHRGNRTLKLGGHKQHRGLFYINEGGEEAPILPGDLWESDDMHVNQPFYVPWTDPNDPCAAKYGVRAFRAQLLPVLDVGSARFMSYGLTLRHNDAYRASDILWTFLNIFRSVGVPKHLRFEQGVWNAETVRRLEACARRHTSFTPGTKFIESRFNLLQKVMGRHGVNIGRVRGEFEKTNKDWAAVREGRMHPAQAGFLSAVEMSKALTESMLWINADKMEGEIYKGVPDDNWSRHFENTSLPKLTQEQAILLQPQRREITIDGGHVRCRVAEHNATFYFCNPTEFPKYGTGYKVTVCFDPADPAAGAYILNREEGSRAIRNKDGVAVRADELMCWAQHVDHAPQFSMSRRPEDRENFENKRRYTEQCHLMYGTIMPYNRGTPYKVAQTNDGRGHTERVDVDGTEITRREVGAKERSQEKLVQAARAQERKMGLRIASVIKNPSRVIEGMTEYQKALAELDNEQRK